MSNIIVVGCGRVGSRLATTLSDHGHNVCVVDRVADAFRNLGQGFNGTNVLGVGFDEEVLLRAGIENCDTLAAVTQSDNANLMTAEVAKRLFHVPHVIARLYNPDHERAYSQLGLDYVCGTSLVSEEIFSKISSGHGSHLESFGEFEVLQFSLNLKHLGRSSIRAKELERDHDVRIVAFERSDGSISSVPNKNSVLYQGDSILACVRHDMVEAFSSYMQS